MKVEWIARTLLYKPTLVGKYELAETTNLKLIYKVPLLKLDKKL